MGYRNYIGMIRKDEYEKIKNMDKQQLYKHKIENWRDEDMEDDYVAVYDIVQKKLYELGKYADDFDNKHFKPVFLNEELQKEFEEEHDLYIVGKEFMKGVIERYTKKVQDYYKELIKDVVEESGFMRTKELNEIPDSSIYKILDHIKSMASEWGVCFVKILPYRLDENDSVCTSWKYEYSIFELVRIYKTFDWENSHMIYYGY